LRVVNAKTYNTAAQIYRFSLPYYILLRSKQQYFIFDTPPPGLEAQRTVLSRQQRDAQRSAAKAARADASLNVVARAMHYAELLAQDPQLTKSALAQQLGISRIRVYQMLNILKLSPVILEFILSHDSPELRMTITERRLRRLTTITDPDVQLKQFREIVLPASRHALCRNETSTI
jgi:hypothetical protein